VLFRYVAQGKPPVLLEEVVPVSWSLSTGQPVEAGPLLDGPVGVGQKFADDVVDDARRALDGEALRERLGTVASERAAALATRHADLSAEWATGLDHVEPTSFDVVAITLVYPQVGAA
jgi:hypothetical protein